MISQATFRSPAHQCNVVCTPNPTVSLYPEESEQNVPPAHIAWTSLQRRPKQRMQLPRTTVFFGPPSLPLKWSTVGWPSLSIQSPFRIPAPKHRGLRRSRYVPTLLTPTIPAGSRRPSLRHNPSVIPIIKSNSKRLLHIERERKMQSRKRV